jgi:hypothetical protein
MQNLLARAMIMLPVLMLSSFAHAQTQSSETKEHKGLPPICQGESNRFNRASAPVDGQKDEPAVDFWGRPVALEASPKLRPNERSCDPPARAAGQNYLTIGRALEGLGLFEPRAELRRKPAGKSNPFAGVPVLIIRQLGRSDGASRPGALETRLYPDPWTELCPPAFPFLGPGACGLPGNSEHSPTAGA